MFIIIYYKINTIDKINWIERNIIYLSFKVQWSDDEKDVIKSFTLKKKKKKRKRNPSILLKFIQQKSYILNNIFNKLQYKKI